MLKKYATHRDGRTSIFICFRYAECQQENWSTFLRPSIRKVIKTLKSSKSKCFFFSELGMEIKCGKFIHYSRPRLRKNYPVYITLI